MHDWNVAEKAADIAKEIVVSKCRTPHILLPKKMVNKLPLSTTQFTSRFLKH